MRTLVNRQASRPVAIATTAGHTASPIAGRLAPGRDIRRDGVPGGFIPRILVLLGLIRDRSARLATNRPTHRDPSGRDGPAQHHLLCLARLAGAEIDAFAEANLAARGTQPPRAAARQAQQRGAAIADQPGLNRRVQVEANREDRPGETGQPVLAAQVLTVGGEEQLACIDQPEALAIAVMRPGDPLLTLVLGPLASDRSRDTP